MNQKLSSSYHSQDQSSSFIQQAENMSKQLQQQKSLKVHQLRPFKKFNRGFHKSNSQVSGQKSMKMMQSSKQNKNFKQEQSFQELIEMDYQIHSEENSLKQSNESKIINSIYRNMFKCQQNSDKSIQIQISTNKIINKQFSKQCSINQNNQKYLKLQEKLQNRTFKDYKSSVNFNLNKNEKKFEKEKLKMPATYSLVLRRTSGFARLKYELNLYHDHFCLLEFRKQIIFIIYTLFIICKQLARNIILKIIMSVTIIFNISLFIYKNIHNTDTDIYQSIQFYQKIVMYIYLSEILLKIIASGIIFIKYSYLRFIKNWFDLILITLYILHIMNPESIIDISPLRLITLLIYLGHMIKGIVYSIMQGLQIMLNALARSFKFISEALIVVALFTVFFALIGTSLFQGLINFRCIPIDGSETPNWIFCNGNKCPLGMICQEQNETPNIPTSFNNIFYSFAQVLRTITMDDWSYVMFFTLKTYSTLVWVYYIFIILIGGFFGFNLVIAVLKTLYGESVLIGETVEKIDTIDLQNLKQTGQYELLSQFKNYISGDLMLNYHSNIQTNGSNGPRILSGKKRLIIPKIFFHNLKNCNLKHLLLPKFRNLNNYRSKMNHSNYEQYDELFIKYLYFEEFTKFQPVPIYDEYYSYSEGDVLLCKVYAHKQQSYAKNKFKMIYRVKLSIKHSIHNKSKWPQKQGRQLNQIKRVIFDENEKNLLCFERQLNQRSVTFAAHKKSTIISFKHLRSMPFSTKREGEIYINVQGIFLNYKGLCEKIHLKIPKRISDIVDYETEYFQIRKSEQITKRISHSNLSVKNILFKYDGYEQLKQQLNVRDTLIWLQGTSGHILIIRKYIYILLTHQLSQIIIDFIIFINFLLLSLLGIISNKIISNFEDFTTICLVTESCLRILAYSPTKFIKNSQFLVETIIIAVNFIELTLSPYLNLDELQLRLLRATKAILFYRCLKYNKMAVIIGCIAQKTFKQYIYLTFLMFFAILTYGLMGMEMYAGKFDQQDQIGQLHSYDDPFKSWMTIFNIMTNDDWYGVLVLGSNINVVFSLIYSLSMVFFLNYITFGLVMAILLDGFGQYLGESETITLDQIEENSQVSKQQIQQQSSDSEVDDDGAYSPRKIQEEKSINSEQNSKESTYYYLLESIGRTVKENAIKKANIFNGIFCRESLFIFNKQNRVRIFCCLFYRKSVFKLIDHILIIGSITIFALQTYQQNQELLENLLILFNFLIIIQKLILIIALGFFFDRGAYVQHLLQIFDIVYLLIFILKLLGLKSQIMDILLYLRFLRPLDLLYCNEWIKYSYQILTVSLKNMLDVLFTMVIIWIMFAVFGMILYQNQFGYCEDKMNFNISKIQCLDEGRYWTTFQHNFDNITAALPTLFVISTFDGWGEILQVAENSQPADHGPIPFSNQYPTYIFLVVFCFIGSMFFLSLFTGLLFLNYKAQEQKIEFDNLTQAQQEFMSISQKIFHDKVAFSYPPKNYVRKLSQQIINNKLFLNLSFFVMVIDTLIQLSFYSEMDLKIAINLNTVYQVVSYLFIVFVIIQVTSYGFHRYFDDSWRQFYLFILMISLIDLILDYQNNWFTKSFKSNVYTEYFQLYRVMFALRNFRMLILIQGFQGLQRLVRVMVFALPFLAKLLFILLITTISFALIGQQLYGEIDKGSIIDEQINFKTFTSSLLTLLKCASCDNFRSVMTDTMIHNPFCREDPKYCGSQYSQIYFILFVFISNYVLINLFVLGLIEQFEKFFQMQNSMIQVYIEKIDQIKTIWCQYSYQKQGKAMHYKFIGKFLMDLGEPFVGKDYNLWDNAKLSGYFKIKADEYGYIKFNHLIYELFRRTFKNEVFKKGPEGAIKIVKAFNKEMQLRLYYSRKDHTLRRNQITTFIELNPNYSILHDYLSVLIIFKAWQAYSSSLLQLSKNLENFTDRSSLQNKNDEWDIFSQEDEEESSLSKRSSQLRNLKIQSERHELSRDEIALPIYEEELRHMQLGLIPVQGESYSQLSVVSSMDGLPNLLKKYDQPD